MFNFVFDTILSFLSRMRLSCMLHSALDQAESEATATLSHGSNGRAVQASTQLHAAQGIDHDSLEKKLDELVNLIKALKENMTVVGAAAASVALSDAEYCYEC
jgi:hypothetical protein